MGKWVVKFGCEITTDGVEKEVYDNVVEEEGYDNLVEAFKEEIKIILEESLDSKVKIKNIKMEYKE